MNTGKLGGETNRNSVLEVGERPREEEVVLGKGSEMTPGFWAGEDS